MNKLTKRVLSVFLALAMIVTILPPVTAQAATKTEKMTLYKGEIVKNYVYGTLKSVSSSKKAVATVKKDSGNAVITAKKPGKATISIKTNRGTFKYAVTVKKLDVTATLSDMGNGNMLLTVKNNTKQTFTYVSVDYVIKNDQGETVKTDTKLVDDVVAGKTVYDYVYYDSYHYTIDETLCSAKVVGDDRSLIAKYKNVTSSIKTTIDEDTSAADTIKLTIKSKNTQKKEAAYVDHYVLIYNSMDQVIGLKTVSFYLKAGKLDTNSTSIDTSKYSSYKDYAYHKVVTVAYSTVY
jgi:hypothetical protein